MALSSSDILDAYRADLSNADKTEFSAGDATWLAFGTLLQRAVGLAGDERGAYLQSAAAAVAGTPASAPMTEAMAALAADGNSASALYSAVKILASEAEEFGAFALATAMLDFARILVGLNDFRLQGRLLTQQARILRKIGELIPARELLDEVYAMGTAHADEELIARAHVGRGILGRLHGNYPDARREFGSVLGIPASSPELRELHVHAHHGLLIVAATARDFDAALQHGALAVAGALTEAHRVELLSSLSAVCYDAGQFRSSLHGYLHALAETRLDRVRIGACGGAAVSAARLGDRRIVDSIVEAARPLLVTGHDFELADMTREFAEAYAYLGDVAQADLYRDEGLRRARRGNYFEIVHRLESLRVAAHHEPPREIALTRDAQAVAAHLASGDSGELLAAAVSSGHWDSHSH